MRAARTHEAVPAGSDLCGDPLYSRLRMHPRQPKRHDSQPLDCLARRRLSPPDHLFFTIKLKLQNAAIRNTRRSRSPERHSGPQPQASQVGTIVESLAPDVYEVEFSDDEGRTYATLSLPAPGLIRLYHEPAREAAWQDAEKVNSAADERGQDTRNSVVFNLRLSAYICGRLLFGLFQHPARGRFCNSVTAPSRSRF